jgi:hypothetical protein
VKAMNAWRAHKVSEVEFQALRRFEFFELGEEVPEVIGNILLGQAEREQRSDQSPSPPPEVADRQDLHMAAAAVRGRGADLPSASRFERLDAWTVPLTAPGVDQS